MKSDTYGASATQTGLSPSRAEPASRLGADALQSLALRCESAEEAKREIDRDIALYFDLYDQPEDLGCFEDEAEAVVGGGGQTWAPLEYTASIDAAAALVPEDFHLRLSGLNDAWHAEVNSTADGQSIIVSRNASTAPLAICAAALKARAAIAIETQRAETEAGSVAKR